MSVPATPARRRRYHHLLFSLLLGSTLLAPRDSLAEYNVVLVSQWQQLVRNSGALPVQQKLQRINHFFNQHIRFEQDPDIWQQRDYWATPKETLLREAGIAKPSPSPNTFRCWKVVSMYASSGWCM